jgi:putative CRISPR-associated protein (TIGR02620 family)
MQRQGVWAVAQAAGAEPHIVIATQNVGTLEWLARRGISGRTVAHLDINEVEPGSIVVGNLPAHLVVALGQRGARYWHIVLETGPEHRGTVLDADAMEALGARLMAIEANEVTGVVGSAGGA